MAKIIFGVQGEGMGHATRSAILIKHLVKKNKVRIFAGNRAYKYLKERFKDVEKIESQNLAYKSNRVRISGTLRMNIKKRKQLMQSFSKIKNAIKKFKPDLIMNDYEGLTNLAAKTTKTKLICVDNQNDITFSKGKPSFTEFLSFLGTKEITTMFTLGADKYIVYSINPGKNTNKKIYVGNLINDKIIKQKTKYDDYIFVYQTSKSNQDLVNILKELKEKFVIYGFNTQKKDKNLIFRKFNDTVFYKDLACAKAVITNGGLSLITEAIYLKKPLLSIPIQGQFEQLFNAKTIDKNGFGMYIKKPKKDKIIEFLSNGKEYKKNLKNYKAMNNKQIFEKIDEIIKEIKP